MPLTVDWLICSYDVHVLTLRLVQPPLDVRVMPDADSCEAACASVSLVTAWAGDAGAEEAGQRRRGRGEQGEALAQRCA